MKKPNLFVIGAPKCGTTSLAAWLAEHPAVYFSHPKEPEFFNRDGMVGIRTLEAYERLFVDAGEQHLVVGEGSTNYLYSREALPRILEYSPNAKFIVCIRNPIDMARSLHAERLSRGEETVSSFEKAWFLQRRRAAGKGVPLSVRGAPDLVQYGSYCRLGEQLERVYQYVSSERVLPVLLDDIKTNPRVTYLTILAFLGLPDDGRSNFSPLNTAKRTRFPGLAVFFRNGVLIKQRLGINISFGIADAVKKRNVLTTPRDPPSAKVLQELSSYFEDDVRVLERLIGRDLSKWLVQEEEGRDQNRPNRVGEGYV